MESMYSVKMEEETFLGKFEISSMRSATNTLDAASHIRFVDRVGKAGIPKGPIRDSLIMAWQT